ncbi:MAG: tRNA pseudouridine(38-40) synthase TruA [Pseudomonadota bacterium]
MSATVLAEAARYRLTVEYDGRPFVGLQRQTNGLSVQEAIETAAARYCGAPVVLHAAGRTDAGVHALAMTCHVELPRDDGGDVVRDALNHHLRPHPVSILDAAPANEDFHARFSCVGRRYAYRILVRRARPALDDGRVWHVPHALDEVAMAAGARRLIGRHDFTTFRSSDCQADSPVRTMDAVTVEREGDEIIVRCAARSFLHHQVRSIVGTLERVGAGRWSAEDVTAALEARDRAACGPVAPPDGLYFVKALYPDDPTSADDHGE